MSTEKKCRWGIMGSASIANKNWKSIYNAENSTLAAVASRTAARAQEFIDTLQAQVAFEPAPEAVEGYETLLQRDDIDAVYIPLPTGIRKEWVIRAAQAGKHVLAEKPCGNDASEVEEMVAACREHGVQYMDGVMFMHSDRLAHMRQTIDSGQLGDVRRIATQFSFFAPQDFRENNIRVHSSLESLGCLGDLGWYNIRFTLWAMNYQMPERVTGRLLSSLAREDSPDQVPTEFSGEMFFPGGVTASFFCSFLIEHQQWANISGTKGYLQVQDFVLPHFGSDVSYWVANDEFEFLGCDFNMKKRRQHFSIPEYSSGFTNAQESKLFHNFAEIALSGKTDDFWADVAVKTQQVLDASLKSARNGGEMVELG